MDYKTANLKMIADEFKWAKAKGYGILLFLGSGMSETAGIPCAQDMIQELKKHFPHFAEKGDKETYQAFMSLLSPVQRKEFITPYIENAKINMAHLYLGSLVNEKYIDCIFTTNFDTLVIQSLALFNVYPAVYDIAATQSFTTLPSVRPSVFYLHGQRDSFILLHTEKEKSRYSETLKDLFQDFSRGICWIVIGFNGDEDPVFECLANINLSRNKLFWIGLENEKPPEHVLENILTPNKFGYYVKGYNADTFFFELSKELELPEPPIISKPFSFLKHTNNSISQFSLEDKQVDPSKEIKKWLEYAITGFEEGKGFDRIKGIKKSQIDDDQIIRKSRNIWMYNRYNQLSTIYKNIAQKDLPEAQEYLALALINWGKEKVNLAKNHAGKESEKLFKQSFEKYEMALKLKPDMYEALNNWGTALVYLARMKDGNESEELFKQSFEKYEMALKLKPDMYNALNNWGTALENLARMKKGNEAKELFKQSIENYERALKIKPDDHETLNNWGTALENLSRMKKEKEKKKLIKQSIEKYKSALHCKPDYYKALNNWGNALSDLAMMTEGKEAEELFKQCFEKYQKALESEPDDYITMHNWGIVLLECAKMKDGKEANKLYKQSFEKFIKSEEIMPDFSAYNLTCLYSLKGDLQKSLMWLEKGLQLKTEPSRSHILTDSDLDNIRHTENFDRIVNKYRPE